MRCLPTFVLVCVAGIATADESHTCPSAESLYSSPKVSTQQLLDLMTSVKLRPGTHCRNFAPKEVQCNSDSLPELWWFTEPGHPAYPSASRGQILYNKALRQTCLIRDGYFAGQEAPFADWMMALKKYDEMIVGKALERRDDRT